MKNKGLVLPAIIAVVICVAIVGEVKCIIKACKCNWEPIGKAEVFYTGAAFTPIGCIMGYIDIEDK